MSEPSTHGVDSPVAPPASRNRWRSWLAGAASDDYAEATITLQKIALLKSSLTSKLSLECARRPGLMLTKGNSLKRAAPAALPESVAWMQTLDMQMTTKANKKLSLVKRNNTLYELQLSLGGADKSRPASASHWTVAHTFDEYRAFQRRLVKALKPGHKCNAECRWLLSVVKRHFPRASLFCKNCPATVESRRLALLRVLSTIKNSLVNHGNMGCAVLRDEVSKEFAAFVVGSCKDAAVLQHTHSATPTTTPATASSEDDLTASVVSFTSDEENQVLGFEEFDDEFSDFSDFECGLCGCTLDTEEGSPYCTSALFECGHQFHDACVLPVLDEQARCPLCHQ